MNRNSKLVKAIKLFYQKLCNDSPSTIKEQSLWLLRTFLVTRRQPDWANAGFVLPTVAMVALVVVLLTTAILFRSFDRSKNASNVRVNEAVFSAASPAIERARAKVEQLFRDLRLPRSTPSDFSLDQVINNNLNEFTFGDETQLKLVKEYNGTTNIQNEETLKTAWKYPVDTDNDGKFDSYTLYGIYYRTPTTNRARSVLEARAQPMNEGDVGTKCPSEVPTSANLVSTQGWYKVGNKLKRSFFVYTTIVPITELTTKMVDSGKYEKFTGNKGFVALEYQQDRERIPLNNNAVLYEDDLEIAPGGGISLNGRIFTNGNLLTRRPFDPIRFYLVSSPKSCYFKEENSKIIVAGNVIDSRLIDSSSGGDVKVDLFDESYTVISAIASDNINNTNKTVPSDVYANKAAYNDEAYARRIDRLVDATNKAYPDKKDLPEEVTQEIDRDITADPTLDPAQVRNEKLRIYFRKRTRRVPYAEIASSSDPLKYGTYDFVKNSPLHASGSGESLRPVDEWVFPYNPSDGKTSTNYASIGIKENGGQKLYLPATDPAEQVKVGKERKIGDRILVGNNLPQLWYDTNKGKFLSSPDQGQTISGKEWDVDKDGKNITVPRKRFSQAYQLDDLGITDRGDFWEKSAAQEPQGPLDVVGGMRVITGAGIYLPNGYTPSSSTAQFTSAINDTDKVWADTMPVGVTSTAQGLPKNLTPYLQMRATVVYHYQNDFYDPKKPTDYQNPIACVSSYYDPTSSTTARNKSKDFGGKDLLDVSLRDTQLASPNRDLTGLPKVTANPGNSINGVVYSASSLSTSGYEAVLSYQTQLKYPNGRLVNELLKKALKKIADSKSLTLAEQSAVDSAMCALKILDGSIGDPTDTVIPHGAIMETAFLDARQIKAIDKPTSASSKLYDLDVELRQPLEVRATVLDLDLLRKKATTNGKDFLIPNSGIIYATRDDALADASDPTSKDVSATDFKLDPTRRPNAIMLINGSDLSRNTIYKPEEKGLIVVSNLQVYIQAQQIDKSKNEGFFNRHTHEEFTDKTLKGKTDWTSDFYSRQTLNPNFACRQGQFSDCNTGESWRPASVIADSITVLSHNFRVGFREQGDYDLRNNYDNLPIGYDFDASGGSPNPATLVTLDETAIKFDVNGNGNMNDTAVSTIDESTVGVDLNNDGDKTDISVAINESNITATVAARLNGFWDNNFVTSFPWQDNVGAGSSSGYGFPADLAATPSLIKSSYFNNFVTPIQRRVQFPEYVMEMCRKPVVAGCGPDDWVVGYDSNGDQDFNDPGDDSNLKASQLTPDNASYTVNKLGSGTTARPALMLADRRYPRRIAFLRNSGTGMLILTGAAPNLKPIPIGIKGSDNPADTATDNAGRVYYYPYDAYSSYLAYNGANNRPRLHRRALWFKTANGASANYGYNYPLWVANSPLFTTSEKTDQPLLIPVLQIQYPFIASGGDLSTLIEDKNVKDNANNWMQNAVATETNLIFAQGNTPARPNETNGGLENLVGLLENWGDVNHIAAGAFIQLKRSAYATAPWQIVTAGFNNTTTGYSSSGTIFGYPQGYRLAVTSVTGQNLGRSPFFIPPKRAWGYDVALLSQLPDLFSLRFTTPATNEPNEFYREVGRDDSWVKTLLCAVQDQNVGGYENADSTLYGSNFKYAISQDQRGVCP